MNRRFQTVSTPLLSLLLLAGVLPAIGCDPVGPARLPVADTTRLFSLSRAEFQGQRSGFDLTVPRTVVVDEPGTFDAFDLVFSELSDGTFVMMPAGVFEGLTTTPGIIVEEDETFESLERAPEEGWVTDEPVELEVGGLYVARSRTQRRCRYYGKLEVLDLDPDGILEFRYLASNLCNDRVLTDTDDD